MVRIVLFVFEDELMVEVAMPFADVAALAVEFTKEPELGFLGTVHVPSDRVIPSLVEAKGMLA